MLEQSDSLHEVSDMQMVARYATVRNPAVMIENRLVPKTSLFLFNHIKQEVGLSVFMLANDEIAHLRSFTRHIGANKIFGAAKIQTSEIRQIGLDVKDVPTFEGHAEIIGWEGTSLNPMAQTANDTAKAALLAAQSDFIQFDPPIGKQKEAKQED